MAMNILALIILIVGLLIGVILAFAMRRYQLWCLSWQRVILILIGLTGSCLVLSGTDEIGRSLAKQKWHETKGLVIRSEVIGEGAYRPNIVYQFDVENRTFTDSTALSPPSFGGRNARRKAAETKVANYSVGDTVYVYYNPVNPEESVLNRHLFWAVYMKLSFGLLLYIAGLAFLLAGFIPFSAQQRSVR